MTNAAAPIELTVTDLKQHAYCPRIPYYQYVLPVGFRKPYKMARGHHAQAAVEALEKRRGFRAYGLAGAERLFGLTLRSERLGLVGKLDLVLRTAHACYPVDFKDSEGPVRANLRLQVAAYALLVEEGLGMTCPAGFIYFVPRKRAEVVEVDAVLRARVLAQIDGIRRSIATEAMPEPTDVRARCSDCEYRNYCGDIW